MLKSSQLIRDRILSDNNFSLDIAKLLQIQQYSVKELAKRNSDKLVLYVVVQYYLEQGIALEDVFEKE